MGKNKVLVSLVGFFNLLLFLPSAFAEKISRLNMTQGVTPISKDIYDLHMIIFYICCAIGAVVFGILFYALVKYRKSKGAVAATFHENLTIEIIWAVVPLIILIVMAIPATKVLMKMNDTADSSLTVAITGYQWKWKYEYLDQGISFFSNLSTPLAQIDNKEKKDKWYLLEVDKPIVLPIKEKIRFLITSNDVIHSWWVPALGVKKDAVPGFIHEEWTYINKPGIYRGQCAELCGANHGYMPIVVKAVTQAEFKKWVEKQNQDKKAEAAAQNKTYNMTQLMDMGKKNYDKYCAACHQANGEGIANLYPALKADSVAVGNTVNRHIKIILDGIPGSAMQAFGPQLTDTEIASIVTYERNAWDNNTNQKVQPQDVAKLRK